MFVRNYQMFYFKIKKRNIKLEKKGTISVKSITKMCITLAELYLKTKSRSSKVRKE